MAPSASEPLVSVVMPVYNAATYLAETIESILGQTYGNFELLILNDGSRDASADIVRSFRDERIRFFDFAENAGLVQQLNYGFGQARGEFIARMDADDIALPQRLARQVALLQSRPEIGLCSCWIETIGPDNQMAARPVGHADIRHWLLFGNPIAHPAVMLRAGLLRQHQLRYEASRWPAEDYFLWCQLAQLTQLYIMPEVLLRYRIHAGQISSQRSAFQIEKAAETKLAYLHMLGVQLGPDDEARFRQLVIGPPRHTLTVAQLRAIAATARVVTSQLAGLGFDAVLVRQIMALYWWQLLENVGRFRPGLIGLFAWEGGIPALARLKLLAKALLGWQPRVSQPAT